MNCSSNSIDKKVQSHENEVTREDYKPSTAVLQSVEQQLSLQHNQQQQEECLENTGSKPKIQRHQSQDKHEKHRPILEQKNQCEQQQQKQQHAFHNRAHVAFGAGGATALLAAAFSAKQSFKDAERSIKEEKEKRTKGSGSQEVSQEQRVQHHEEVQKVVERNHRYEEKQQKPQHGFDNGVHMTFGQGGAAAYLAAAFSAKESFSGGENRTKNGDSQEVNQEERQFQLNQQVQEVSVRKNSSSQEINQERPVKNDQNEIRDVLQRIRRFEIEQQIHHELDQAKAHFQKAHHYSVFLEQDDHLTKVQSVVPTFTRNMLFDDDEIHQFSRHNWTCLEYPFMKNVNLSDRACKLFAAAKNNDIEEINLSIRSGDDLDVEDNSGITPILMALIHKNYDAAKILRTAQIDVINEKLLGSNPSSKSFYDCFKSEIESMNSRSFVQKMISKGFEPARIGEILAALNFYIADVVCHKNSVITKAFLETCTIAENDMQIVFPPTMLDFDVKHINVLINFGPKSRDRKDDFVMYFFENICEYDKSVDGQDFLKKLACWDMIDEELVDMFEDSLRRIPEKQVKIFLKYNFHSIAKKKFNRDMTRVLFGNYQITSSVLEKEDIDVGKRHLGGNTLLHIASKNFADSNIRLLLNKDADPNDLNDDGDTPLSLYLNADDYSYSYSVRSIKLLLLAGANPIIVINRFENTFYGFDSSNILEENAMVVVKLLVAQLAVYEAVGISVEDPIKKFISLDNQELKKFLKGCRQQLNRLKRRTSNDENRHDFKISFNILKILAERPEQIIRHINEEILKLMSRMLTIYHRKSLNFYYRDLLKQRIEEINELYRYRNKAIEVICDFTGIKDSNHLVVQKIVNYFTVRDLKFYKEKNEREDKSLRYKNKNIEL